MGGHYTIIRPIGDRGAYKQRFTLPGADLLNEDEGALARHV